MLREWQQRQHHQKGHNRHRRRTLLLATYIRLRVRRTGGVSHDGRLEPVVRNAERRILVRVGVQEVAILGIQEQLQQRVAVRSRSAATVFGW